MTDTDYRVGTFAPDILFIEEGHVRMWLLLGARKAILVDTGFGRGELAPLVRRLAGDRQLRVVLTHGDGDHTGAVEQFERVAAHPAEFDYLAARGGLPRGIDPLWEGTVLDLGAARYEVLLIPGHTPGSIALHDPARGVLIAGDSVQRGPIFMFGQGRNMTAWVASMKRLAEARRELGEAAFAHILSAHHDLVLDGSIFADLIAGGEAWLAGELSGEDPGTDRPCRLYRAPGVAFFAP
ncbi:MAG: MBL fold metallo-hydrolase [Bacillota bacterium]|nr:MBL fold metallo-hydrolase [Bacillota bacterium]